MQITGMLWGRKLLDLVEYPHSEVRGPELSVDDIKDMIKRHNEIFIKPVFKGGVGKKGKSGLIGRAKNLCPAAKVWAGAIIYWHDAAHPSRIPFDRPGSPEKTGKTGSFPLRVRHFVVCFIEKPI